MIQVVNIPPESIRELFCVIYNEKYMDQDMFSMYSNVLFITAITGIS